MLNDINPNTTIPSAFCLFEGIGCPSGVTVVLGFNGFYVALQHGLPQKCSRRMRPGRNTGSAGHIALEQGPLRLQKTMKTPLY